MAFSTLVKNIGIDIGTVNTHVYAEGRGIVLSEPSVVATDSKQESIVAVGYEAERLLHRMPDLLKSMTPLEDGVIADYRVVLTMLRYFMQKALGKSVSRANVIVSVPCGMTVVEQRALCDAILQAGAVEAYLLESSVAAALGANLPIFDPIGNLVVDIGGGSTDVAVISLGGTVIAKSARIGGLDFNDAILQYIRQYYNVMVAEETIEEIKVELGSVFMEEDLEEELEKGWEEGTEKEVSFSGRDTLNGLTKKMTIRQSEVRRILEEPFSRILEVVHVVLEQTPPELAADIVERGLTLTGAAASLGGLPQRLAQELGIPVHVPKDPGFSVVLGLSRAFNHMDLMERLFISTKNRKGRR